MKSSKQPISFNGEKIPENNTTKDIKGILRRDGYKLTEWKESTSHINGDEKIVTIVMTFKK